MTKGQIVEKVSENLYRVRIAQYDRFADANNSTPDKDLSVASCSVSPGVVDPYEVGDIVWILLEEEKWHQPVIVGLLYRPDIKNKSGLHISNLIIDDWARLPEDTEIGSVNYAQIQTLNKIRGNIQDQIDYLRENLGSGGGEIPGDITELLDKKADKVIGATNGVFPTLNSQGNLVNSIHSPSSFVPRVNNTGSLDVLYTAKTGSIQGTTPIDILPTENTIVLRTETGTVRTGTPVNENDAINKSTFDTSLQTLENLIPEKISDLEDDTNTTPILRATGDSEGNNIVNTYIKIADIVNDLVSTTTSKPLSALQGKLLKDILDTKEFGRAFETVEDMVDYLNEAPATEFRVVFNFFIVNLNSPDFWVTEVMETSVEYEYTTDEALEDEIKSGPVQIGYYKISILETAKVDLTNYVQKTLTIAGLDLQNDITKAELQEALDFNTKVDKVEGKQLSAEDYTATEKSKLAGIAAGAQVNIVTSVAGKTGAISLDKADIGLGNVDNTSDANKPISTLQQAALDAKANNTELRKKAVQPYIQRAYSGGNGPRLVGTYNYSTSVGDTRPLFYMVAKQGHGNGTSYLFWGEFIFGVSTTGVVTAKAILKVSDGTYGKFYYRHDTANKILYLYIYTGQYSSAYFSDLIQINAGDYSSYFTLVSAGSVTSDTVVEGVNVLYPASGGTIALTSQLPNVQQTTGQSTTEVMSQKAVTDAIKTAIYDSWGGEY